MVTCESICNPSKVSKAKLKNKNSKPKICSIYRNVHAVLNPEKVKGRYNNSETGSINDSYLNSPGRELSVLMLGIDSVSRLNFHRSMPLLSEFFKERNWLELKGYNKMGDNTFPNLMAFLTGMNPSDAYSKCHPKKPYGLDNCSIIWYNFRDNGYVTAYGEDHESIGTFNYLKVNKKLKCTINESEIKF